MRERVEQFKTKKETERREFAEKQMDLKWRAGCDELRLAESKLLVKLVSQEREQQFVEKKLKQIELDNGSDFNYYVIIC